MRHIFKLLSITLSVVLLVSVFAPFNSFAESAPVIKGSSVDAQIGEKAVITFNISDAGQVCGGNFNIVYDNEYLQVVSYKAGSVFSDSAPVINTKYQTNKVRVIWAGINPLKNDGDMLSLEFLVKDNAPSGALRIAVESLKLYDYNSQLMTSNAADAEIEVKNTYMTLTPENNGENISVSVGVSGDTVFQGGNYTLCYDNTVLTPVSVAKGALLAGTAISYNTDYASNAVRVSWAGITPVTEKGEICKVIFAPKDDFSGNISFELKDVKLYDENENLLVVQTEKTDFTIEKPEQKAPHITIGTVTCKDEGVLSVILSEASMLCGGSIEIKYDNARVSIASALPGELMNGKNPVINTQYEADTIKLSWASPLPVTDGGELMKIYFKVQSETNGFAAFDVKAQSLYGENTNPITAGYTNGGVVIEGKKTYQILLSDVSVGNVTSFTIQLTSPDSISGEVIVAVYNRGASSMSYFERFDAIESKDIDVSTPNGETVKVMWWNAAGGLKPVAPSVTVSEK